MFLDNLKRFRAGKRRTFSATVVLASQGKSGTYAGHAISRADRQIYDRRLPWRQPADTRARLRLINHNEHAIFPAVVHQGLGSVVSERNRRIDPRELKRLSILEPQKSLTAIAADWAIIAAAIAVSEYAGHVVIYLLAVILIAGRMHALGCLVHEAAHYRIIKNRKLSDWMSDLLLAWPMLATVDGYRQNHLAHHQHANTDDDPDWTAKLGMRQFTFPQKVARGVMQLLGYLVAVNSIRDMVHMAKRMSK
ncbi:MAG: fatty acid desaturase, partial [Ensifer adhaerens]